MYTNNDKRYKIWNMKQNLDFDRGTRVGYNHISINVSAPCANHLLVQWRDSCARESNWNAKMHKHSFMLHIYEISQRTIFFLCIHQFVLIKGHACHEYYVWGSNQQNILSNNRKVCLYSKQYTIWWFWNRHKFSFHSLQRIS